MDEVECDLHSGQCDGQRCGIENIGSAQFGFWPDNRLQRFWLPCHAAHTIPVVFKQREQSAADITAGTSQ